MSMLSFGLLCFFFSSRRRHTRCLNDWSSDVCSSDLVHLYRAVGDEGDVAWIALVSDAVATHVGNRLHVEDIAIEFIHRPDVRRGKVDVMQLELHEVAFRSAATSWRADFIRYCKSEPVMTNRAPSSISSATCSTSARIPPTPRCLPCALQAFAASS